jgi:hypothetical protein
MGREVLDDIKYSKTIEHVITIMVRTQKLDTASPTMHWHSLSQWSKTHSSAKLHGFNTKVRAGASAAERHRSPPAPTTTTTTEGLRLSL